METVEPYVGFTRSVFLHKDKFYLSFVHSEKEEVIQKSSEVNFFFFPKESLVEFKWLEVCYRITKNGGKTMGRYYISRLMV